MVWDAQEKPAGADLKISFAAQGQWMGIACAVLPFVERPVCRRWLASRTAQRSIGLREGMFADLYSKARLVPQESGP